MESGVDNVALPRNTVGHRGDVNLGVFGGGGPLAALFGGEIYRHADGVTPGAAGGAQCGGMPSGRQAGRQFAVHVPAIAACIPQEDRMRAVGAYARKHIEGREISARALEPYGYVVVVR